MIPIPVSAGKWYSISCTCESKRQFMEARHRICDMACRWPDGIEKTKLTSDIESLAISFSWEKSPKNWDFFQEVKDLEKQFLRLKFTVRVPVQD